MTKRTGNRQGTQEERPGSPALEHLIVPLVGGMTATRESLLLTLGGRRIRVPRPPVRGREGGEVTLPSVAAFRGRDPLTARVLEQILLGVSTRGYAASLEAGPVGVPSRGTSRSAVSRRTREQVATQLSRRLDNLDLVALFDDGVVLAGQTVIVLQGISRDGRKEPLGAGVDSTENAAVCTQLLHHADAAASLREGLEETLTVLKLGLPPRLRRFFATSNAIENLIGTLRHVARNVKRWRNGAMIRSWVGLGVLRAAARLRQIKGHCDLAALATTLRPAAAGEPAA